MLKTPVTGDLQGHFVFLEVPLVLGVVAGWFFPPYQSVFDFVWAPIHDLSPDVEWLASSR